MSRHIRGGLSLNSPYVDNPGDFKQLPDAVMTKYFPAVAPGRMCRGYSHDDGTCLFHALHICMLPEHKLRRMTRDGGWHPDPSKGHALRKRVADTVNKHDWNSFWSGRGVKWYPTARSIKKRFAKPSVWSDVWMIVWAGRVLKHNIYFFDSSTKDLYCGLDADPALPSLFVWWQSHSHFEPILLLETDKTMPLAGTFPPVLKPGSSLPGTISLSVSRGHKGKCQDVELADVVPTRAEDKEYE